MQVQAFTSIALTLSLLVPCVPAVAQPAGEPLTVFVLEGDRAINNVRTRQATPPVVEVRDPDGHPVEGAEVLFELPKTGPGAFFPKDERTQAVKTNHQGQATVTGYTPNSELGRFTIRVTAKFGNSSGKVLLTQTNSNETHARAEARPRSGGKKKWILLGLAAGAAAGTAVGVSRRNSGPTDVVLAPGGVAVSGPRQ